MKIDLDQYGESGCGGLDEDQGKKFKKAETPYDNEGDSDAP